MVFNPDIHHRRSIRLKGWDYSQAGAYYITICAYQRECLFGYIENGEMYFSEYGQIVRDEWEKTVQIRKEIILDEYVIMPNHFHCIVFIQNNDGTVGINGRLSLQTNGKMRPKSISSLMAGFKSVVSKQINLLRNTPGNPVWQYNYYEHIIRDEHELNRKRDYIVTNPMNWHIDENYL